MTVETISNTVVSVVEAELGNNTANSYAPAITKVSEAITEREYAIVEAIVERANEVYGVSKREVTEILASVGLSVRPAPVVVPEPVLEDEEAVTADDVAKGKRSKGQRIADLEEGQAAILSAIGKLTELAQRHLGASL